MKLFTVPILLIALAVGISARVSYEGDSVVRVHTTPESAEWLPSIISALELDQWASAPGWMDMRIPAALKEEFLETIRYTGLRTSVTIENVQTMIDEQMLSTNKRANMTGRIVDNTHYRVFKTILEEIDELEQAYPDLVSSEVVGKSFEGRHLRVVKVSSDGSDSRPVIWIDCGIHAREWVTPAACMYILDQLSSQYGKDKALTQLLDTYDFHVLPVVNPDGYVYSWFHDRLWHKNRVASDSCHGVDPNRNFDAHFGMIGSSNDPCDMLYHGLSAFSEAESAAVRDASKAIGARLKGFFSLHSYGQSWLSPYGYSNEQPADMDELMRVSAIGVDAIEGVYGTHFKYGTISDVIFVASGGSTDWAYDKLGVTYAFGLELGRNGNFGFLMPESLILPVAEETMAGIVAAIQAFQ